MSLEVVCNNSTYTTNVDIDKPLSFLIQESGVPMDLQCAGHGVCGKCRVELGTGTYQVSGTTVTISGDTREEALSCHTTILSEAATIYVPEESILKTDGQIHDSFSMKPESVIPLTYRIAVTPAQCDSKISFWDGLITFLLTQLPDKIKDTFDHKLTVDLSVLQQLPAYETEPVFYATVGQVHDHWHLIDLDISNEDRPLYAVAVDIGTTTVAAILVDINTGKILGRASSYNQQMGSADDVTSRITAASTPEMLLHLQHQVIDNTINPLITTLCNKHSCSKDDIIRIALAGNTVMSHLFMGIDPASIGVVPFRPVTTTFTDAFAKSLNLTMADHGIVSLVPSISGYIGGDITADIYVTNLHNDTGLSALVDLGTNSEMVLSDNGMLTACAAAAGPAFEGAGLTCGCRATDGAIERINFDSSLNIEYSTIGNAQPIGICGSAIIDFIANGMRSGLINMMGRYDLDLLKKEGRYHQHEACGQSHHACVIAENGSSGKPIVITEHDLEQIMKAKGAVYAGLKTMLTQRGHTVKDLNKIYLAGGFAKFINIANAIEIGMLPAHSESIIEPVGNGSLAGAYLSLLDPAARKSFEEVITLPKVLSLNLIPEFEMNYIDAMMLPHFDPSEFE